ncbi:MAG TPA: hypothetical protein VKH82_07005 [Candidatus Binatia bacterium]|nr:hypothetical protein [Candidatus Binatia bacterium]
MSLTTDLADSGSSVVASGRNLAGDKGRVQGRWAGGHRGGLAAAGPERCL